MRMLDKIRIMSVEELSKYFIYYDPKCAVYFFLNDSTYNGYKTMDEAIDACINWLNSESADGE